MKWIQLNLWPCQKAEAIITSIPSALPYSQLQPTSCRPILKCFLTTPHAWLACAQTMSFYAFLPALFVLMSTSSCVCVWGVCAPVCLCVVYVCVCHVCVCVYMWRPQNNFRCPSSSTVVLVTVYCGDETSWPEQLIKDNIKLGAWLQFSPWSLWQGTGKVGMALNSSWELIF